MADAPSKPPVKPTEAARSAPADVAPAPKAAPKAPAGQVKRPPGPGAQPTAIVAQKPPSFRIEPIQKKLHYLKLLAYGQYGIGKTTLMATAHLVEGMRDVLVISAESGELALEEEQFYGIDVVKVQTLTQLSTVHEYLLQHSAHVNDEDDEWLRKSQARFYGVAPEEIETVRRYRTIVVDSLTEIEDYIMYHILGVGDKTRMDDELPPEEWAEYKKNSRMFQRLVRQFRDLPMHVLFTCGQSWIQDETKKQKYMPELTGKLSTKVQGFMDMVGYLTRVADDAGKVHRVLYVDPGVSNRFDAKHRYARFKGDKFIDPTIGTILQEVGLLAPDGAATK